MMPRQHKSTRVRARKLRRGQSQAVSAALWMAAVPLAACANNDPLTQPTARITVEHVTPTVAAGLTPDGHFVLASAVVNPEGQLSEAHAKAIALRFVADFARLKAADWSAGHGTAIQPSALQPCERALYAASPYAALDGGPLSEVTIRTFGPHWVVPMCGPSNAVQVVITFSALATELATQVESRLVEWDRSDVMSFGVPRNAHAAMYSPEGAALHAFRGSGKRVNSVPVLVMTPLPKNPVLVRWRLDLEEPVRVTGDRSGVTRDRGTLFVGFDETFHAGGMLDRDPGAEAPPNRWTDPLTNASFIPVVLPTAPGQVELVRRTNP